MANIFVTRKILDDGITLLKEAGHSVVVSEKDDALTKEELLNALQQTQYDAVVCTLNDTIDSEVMSAAPTVKIFANYAVGYNNVDLDVAKEKNITITNTPDVLTDAVAEHTITLLFALAKKIPESFRFVKRGEFKGWGPTLFLTTQLKGSALGLVGLGRIGLRVAEIAQCIGIHVSYFDIKRNIEAEERLGITYVESIEKLLAESDFISLHVPLLDSTHHLINTEHLALMKKEAVLINTARGPIVDEGALVQALKEGRLQAAGLDVFENEPELTPGLAELPNVILTPHNASATAETRTQMSIMAAQGIVDFLEGTTPQHKVV